MQIQAKGTSAGCIHFMKASNIRSISHYLQGLNPSGLGLDFLSALLLLNKNGALLLAGALIGRSVSIKKKRITKVLRLLSSSSGDPPGDRTLDPNIKSVMLYQLS